MNEQLYLYLIIEQSHQVDEVGVVASSSTNAVMGFVSQKSSSHGVATHAFGDGFVE